MQRVTIAFILSLARSGSTWLNLVLGSNSWAAGVGELRRVFASPNPVSCRLCQADGLPSCTVLGGIERTERKDVYTFAAARINRPVIVDSSKRLDWCSLFLNNPEIDVRLIHLVRHPCGFIASQRRRFPALSQEDLLNKWEEGNAGIADFAAAAGVPVYFASYDHLIDQPERNFPPLCEFLGHKWETPSLYYWKVPHHGLGSNGANSLYLRGRKVKVYQTGDDGFYAGLLEREPSADRRWKLELSQEFCRLALARPYVVETQRRIGPWEAI